MSNTVTAAATVKVHPPLEVPKPSPRVRISDPDFDKLTTAEKLNDRNYRELIYQTYPNEETCACKPEVSMSSGKSDVEESPSNRLVCRSGCKGACCSSVRQPSVASPQQDNANKNDKVSPAPFMPTYYCVDNPRANECDEDGMKGGHNSRYCGFESRLRGGGEGVSGLYEGGMHPQSGQVSRAMVRSLDDAWNGISRRRVVNRRLEAGGGYEYIEKYPVNRNLLGPATSAQCYNEENPPRTKHCTEQPQRDSHLDTRHLRASPNACRPQSFGTAAGCCCPGKEALVRSTRQRDPCAKKPCPGVDCLIKTFKETQEFVESLGRVPGLAGLGLMDPGESPYFGRARLKDTEAIKSTATFSGMTNLPNSQCVGPCNPRMPKDNGAFGLATPFTIAVPGRGGVVREAVPSMPGPGLRYSTARSRKRDDNEKELDPPNSLPGDIEAAPCGEPRCKAKRRKNVVAEASPSVDVVEDTTKNVAMNINARRNSRAVNKVKGGSKMRSGHRSSEPGPGGDRAGRRKSTRRTMRFVYSAGDSYSGFTCGHKDCIEERRRVPWNMGWLWNVNETVGRLKPRVGWKPGAIARHVSEILREAKTNPLLDHKSRPKTRSSGSSRSKSRSVTSRGKRAKVQGDQRSVKKLPMKHKKEEEEEEAEPPSTLYIRRKDGTYYVTMYPIKQDKMDIPKLEEPMKPLQFKIPKNRDDASVATSSTASDMEIEFSPPAAVNRYRKKPNVVHVDTQVKQQEIVDAFKTDDGKATEKKKGKRSKK